MNTIDISTPLKYITNGRRKVERIHKAGMRDPYWKQRRQHQVIPNKKKQEDKRKCRSKNVYHRTETY
jgi:hypothetical protein